MVVEFRVFRYDPAEGRPARVDTFEVPVAKGMTVLEGLFYILENLDASLAFRCSCRAAICGSCAMHINGRYALACQTQIPAARDVELRPLAHLPVQRDLVVDMRRFFAQWRAIRPYLISKAEAPEREYLQSEEERRRLNGLVDCILCGACYGSCPSARESAEYLGPHALLKALRFIEDSRDGDTAERLKLAASDRGAFRCHSVYNCQEVCPKKLDPADAITRIKRKAAWAPLARILAGRPPS
jgi:succinate dehydrogenase / fumarate reductase iron-sulfur subunit